MRLVYKNNPSLSKENGNKIHLVYKSNPEHGKNIANKLRALYVNNPERRRMIGDFQRGKTHHAFDATIHVFYNTNDGQKFSGTRYDFYNKYNLSKSKVCLLLQGKRKTHKGWVLNTNT